jgi:hypothetical protein
LVVKENVRPFKGNFVLAIRAMKWLSTTHPSDGANGEGSHAEAVGVTKTNSVGSEKYRLKY